MKKIIILLALLLVAVSQGAFAQSMIYGRVVDAKNGSGIPGASVIVKGTTTATTTNSSGNFAMINVPNDAILQVSFIGFKTFEIAVENQTRFDVTLESDVQVLGDVIITASVPTKNVVTMFGIERDLKSLPYVVYQISGDEFRRFGGHSFASTLASNIPSLSVVKISHGAGAIELLKGRLDMIICLYVIDGIPFNIRREIDSGSGRKVIEYDDSLISNIITENIESITYLPSANSAMLYGSAGAAGAIVIELKKR